VSPADAALALLPLDPNGTGAAAGPSRGVGRLAQGLPGLDLSAAARASGKVRLCGAAPRGARTHPCRNLAMGNGRCRLHGGCSTGPRTREGLARSRRAGWKHGERSKAAAAGRRVGRACLRFFHEVVIPAGRGEWADDQDPIPCSLGTVDALWDLSHASAVGHPFGPVVARSRFLRALAKRLGHAEDLAVLDAATDDRAALGWGKRRRTARDVRPKRPVSPPRENGGRCPSS
jgi:hypothetical protein